MRVTMCPVHISSQSLPSLLGGCCSRLCGMRFFGRRSLLEACKEQYKEQSKHNGTLGTTPPCCKRGGTGWLVYLTAAGPQQSQSVNRPSMAMRAGGWRAPPPHWLSNPCTPTLVLHQQDGSGKLPRCFPSQASDAGPLEPCGALCLCWGQGWAGWAGGKGGTIKPCPPDIEADHGA